MRIILKDSKGSTLLELYHAGEIEMTNISNGDPDTINIRQRESIEIFANRELVWSSGMPVSHEPIEEYLLRESE